MSNFNHVQIKRQAHALSRRDSNERWNVFRHIQWDRRPRQASETWDVEGNRRSRSSIPGENELGVPLEHAATSPEVLTSGDTIEDNDSGGVTRPEASDVPVTEAGNGFLRSRKVTSEVVSLTEQSDEEDKPRPGKGWLRHLKHPLPEEPYTVRNQLQRTLLSAWINVLLLLSPAGFALNYTIGKSVQTFVINLVAAIPLLFLNDYALVEITLRVGDQVGGLIYIATANLVQLISCILLIVNEQGSLVQFTVAGGILANLLFILGLAIGFAGINREYMYFQRAVAHVSSNLLSLAATSLLIPTAASLLSQTTQENLARQSRGASFILISVYFMYLLYQFRTHRSQFKERPEIPVRPTKAKLDRTLDHTPINGRPVMRVMSDKDRLSRMLMENPRTSDIDDEESNPPQLHFAVALALFVITATLLYFCIDFAVSSIDALTAQTPIPRTFVGLVLLPIPNCDFAAINLGITDKMDDAMNCTIGKSLQTALLVTPLAVLVAWGLGVDEVTLVFDGFEVVSLFAAVLLLNFLMTDGKVSWIQGVLLLADWGLIALAAFYATT